MRSHLRKAAKVRNYGLNLADRGRGLDNFHHAVYLVIEARALP
jgi:hypothetical protein